MEAAEDLAGATGPEGGPEGGGPLGGGPGGRSGGFVRAGSTGRGAPGWVSGMGRGAPG